MLQHVPATVEHIKTELGKVIVGQEEVMEQVLVALLAEGHALVEGVPGTAKTLLVKTLARIVGADFGRVQFTPDMLPADITGVNIPNMQAGTFTLRRGPVFTDILLADEINRTPPKVQAALLEAMEERRVTLDGETHQLSPLFTGGHCLITGVPGLAKTLLIKTLAEILDLRFKRIQFTPDLMPTDITGTDILEEDQSTGKRSWTFVPGPLFANVLLADEINRTPPKTQAALLEAMQEGQVTVDGEPRRLPDPFLVVATQNPIEYEGTYPLPEAQLDRFLLKVVVGYPSAEEEARVVGNWDAGFSARRLELIDIRPLAEPDAVMHCRAEVRRAHTEPGVQRYLVEIVRRTREHPSVAYGASPRASVALLLCSKALAAMRGRDFTTPDDVRDVARPVLRHRLSLRAEAELEGSTADGVITDILSAVEVPR